MVNVGFFSSVVALGKIWWTSGSMGKGQSLAFMMQVYFLLEQVAALVPSIYIFLFEGLAYSPYALFNEKYGKWDEVDDLPGMQDQIAEWKDKIGRDKTNW